MGILYIRFYNDNNNPIGKSAYWGVSTFLFANLINLNNNNYYFDHDVGQNQRQS